ncbi:hypothetical protein H2199_002696 [Coniosporium tulheliwenetii]|uniref:Uncharacterized protein n=1 Tax=Coniosporium tulheliwenetii TaxID=3383036 RepID=A0ACC2ZFZ7_9PEZI|nr:hypothetical protein H2199_002696 [Cladosporium sp. JES 115]
MKLSIILATLLAVLETAAAGVLMVDSVAVAVLAPEAVATLPTPGTAMVNEAAVVGAGVVVSGIGVVKGAGVVKKPKKGIKFVG